MANGSTIRLRRSAKGDNRRTAMLAAAREVFLSKGFAAATLDDVIAISGGSRATLYAQFGDKEGLFAAIIEDLCADIVTALSDGAGEGDPEAVLVDLGRAYMAVLMAPVGLALYRMVIAEGARYPKLGLRVYQAGPVAAAARLAGYLDSETKRGRLAIDDAQLAARQFLEMVKGDLHSRALFGGQRPSHSKIDACVRSAVQLFLHGSTRRV